MAQVYVSSVLSTSVDKVWAVIRDFNGLPNWTSFVVESRIEQGRPADQIGCVRAFRLTDGGAIREKLIALSDYDYSCSYAILESPMAVENYVATIRLLPITDGEGTFVEWSAEFDYTPETEAELVSHIGINVFQAGINSLKEKLQG